MKRKSLKECHNLIERKRKELIPEDQPVNKSTMYEQGARNYPRSNSLWFPTEFRFPNPFKK